jgi:hypothetical protein
MSRAVGSVGFLAAVASLLKSSAQGRRRPGCGHRVGLVFVDQDYGAALLVVDDSSVEWTRNTLAAFEQPVAFANDLCGFVRTIREGS